VFGLQLDHFGFALIDLELELLVGVLEVVLQLFGCGEFDLEVGNAIVAAEELCVDLGR
jgi:hypothetical protein